MGTQLLQLDWISAPAVGDGASGSLGQIGSQLNNELFCASGTVWLLYIYQKVWMYEYIDKHTPLMQYTNSKHD